MRSVRLIGVDQFRPTELCCQLGRLAEIEQVARRSLFRSMEETLRVGQARVSGKRFRRGVRLGFRQTVAG